MASDPHPIRVVANPNRIIVTANGRTLADSTHSLTLHEASYPGVHYIPRADADMAQLTRSTHTTHCPYKGDANYFSIDGIPGGENAVWTYEQPFPGASAISGYLAFYADRVTIEERPA